METNNAEITRSGLKVGSDAPLFELPGTSLPAGKTRQKTTYRLEDYRGKPVLLVFFSAAFTST